MNEFKASLVISIYNRLDYLRLILAALERQSCAEFEVIIADDGSRPEVVTAIHELMKSSVLAIQHVWQEDLGFRKTRILNEAIRNSRSPYLIFIDGDCVPHQHFVREHIENRSDNTVLAGRRANISRRLQAYLSERIIREGGLEHGFVWRLIADGIFGKSNHVIKGIYVKNRFLRKFLNRSQAGVLGCNFSLWKKDILAVNGFDERYEAPSVGEDTDLEARLRWKGVEIRTIKNMAVQFHFDHPQLNRPSANTEIFKDVLVSKEPFTPFGIIRE